jgi:transcriptional regulator with XRE-family HTH domain
MHDSESKRFALGAFIRAHREQLVVTAKSPKRRRTPGWRREELADAAGIGVTWLTWLEQGREVNASAAVCARLALALQLNPAERASLFELANRRDPDVPAEPANTLNDDVLQLPQLMSVPAYVLDHTWTARAWNSSASELFQGWLDADSQNRNLLHYMFLSRQARALICQWPDRAARLVAEFRADFNRYLGDDALIELVTGLSANSREFADCWRAAAVFDREGGLREFLHPRKGRLQFRQTTLLVPTQRSAKLVCLVPIS